MSVIIIKSALVFSLFLNLNREPSRGFLISSIIEDKFSCQGDNEEEYCNCIKSVFDAVKIVHSSKIKNFSGEDYFYNVDLYKISLVDKDWILLHYYDFNCEGWYRVKGYSENDFKHFYQRVLKYYIKSDRKIKILFESWQKKDPMFAEVDFACLSNALKKEVGSCLISNSDVTRSENNIIMANDNYVKGFRKYNLLDENLAKFSNKPYKAEFPGYK